MTILAPWPNPAVLRSPPWSDSCPRSSLAVGSKPAWLSQLTSLDRLLFVSSARCTFMMPAPMFTFFMFKLAESALHTHTHTHTPRPRNLTPQSGRWEDPGDLRYESLVTGPGISTLYHSLPFFTLDSSTEDSITKALALRMTQSKEKHLSIITQFSRFRWYSWQFLWPVLISRS